MFLHSPLIYFFLISHQLSYLLPTIRSRCIKFKLEKPSFEHFSQIIKNNIEITLINGKWIGKYTLDKQQNLENNVVYCKKFDEDYMILDEPNPNLKIIHFAGPETAIHNCKADWIKSYWNLPKDQEIP